MKRATSLKRSFDVYYRDPVRRARMDQLNALCVPKGGLAFDIGAHVGDRTGSFLRLGARVVAVEPQPRVFRALRLMYGRQPKITLERKAVGASVGTVPFFVNSANPTISTASTELIDAAQAARGWQGQDWDHQIDVPVIRLDDLIAKYGIPDFIKIDVEGYEADVLRGLSHPVPLLSFEFTTIQPKITIQCLQILSALGMYEFNYSLGEEHRLEHARWQDLESLQSELLALPEVVNSGDVFARLRGSEKNVEPRE